jgi:hypothetical protein
VARQIRLFELQGGSQFAIAPDIPADVLEYPDPVRMGERGQYCGFQVSRALLHGRLGVLL